MKPGGIRHRIAAGCAVALVTSFVMVRLAASAPTSSVRNSGTAKTNAGNMLAVDVAHVQQDAVDAYVYGYPLVTMEMTRRVVTNVRTDRSMRSPALAGRARCQRA